MSDITIQDVFQRFYPDYLEHNNVPVVQQKAANAVLFCKTPGMGMNTSVCPDCNNKLIHYRRRGFHRRE